MRHDHRRYRAAQRARTRSLELPQSADSGGRRPGARGADEGEGGIRLDGIGNRVRTALPRLARLFALAFGATLVFWGVTILPGRTLGTGGTGGGPIGICGVGGEKLDCLFRANLHFPMWDSLATS